MYFAFISSCTKDTDLEFVKESIEKFDAVIADGPNKADLIIEAFLCK